MFSMTKGYYDPNIEAKRDELINKVNSYVKQIAAMVDQYRNEFGDEFIEDDDYLRDLDGFVSRLLFGY